MPKAMATSMCAGGDRAACTPLQAFSRCSTMAFQWLLQQVKCLPIISEWPVNDIDDFRVRTGRSRSQGTRTDAYTQLFLKQVQSAVRKAGGNPSRIGGSAGKGSGRFNARGRGAKVVASFPKDNAGWQRDSAGRFRARRVVVKARAGAIQWPSSFFAPKNSAEFGFRGFQLGLSARTQVFACPIDVECQH
jgi:hypothetical protein